MTNTHFSDYSFSDELLKALDTLNYKNPTKVQEQVMPAILEERNIIVKSQTGSGKTAAFAIPICQLVDWNENKPQALVIVPTRELALQVKEDIFNIGRFKRMKVAAVYGRAPFYNQEKELQQKTHIVVGTPGRIIDHLEKGTFNTTNIRFLVIDEADEMLSMGFLDQLETIISSLPKEHSTTLLSATMPKDIEVLCGKYLEEPVYVEIEDQDLAIDRIYQERYLVEEEDKIKLLKDMLIIENPDSCIIFCNTKQSVDDVYKQMHRQKCICEKMHGGMEQKDRVKVMNAFRQGRFRYLVATDVAARGIDIDQISLIMNYDIPRDRENYVHRIGRTGRAGKEGRAITFATSEETRYVKEIQHYIGREIPLRERPESEKVDNSKKEFEEKICSKPEYKEVKGAQLSKDIMKLHINAGKKTKMRPVDIVGTLCSIEGITADDIGIIHIVDISTFVEILNGKGELALQELQRIPIKGRPRKVSKANIVEGFKRDL